MMELYSISIWKHKKAIAFFIIFVLFVSAMGIQQFGIQAQAAEKPVLSYKTVSLQTGKTAKLKLSGAKGKVTWKSKNKKIATVSKSGKVRGKKAGQTTIIATNKKKNYQCTVTVSKKATKTLVAYFSISNTTRKATQKVKAAADGDMVRIQPKKAYTKNYERLLKIANEEYQKKKNPVRATKICNMNQYDRIFIGACDIIGLNQNEAA